MEIKGVDTGKFQSANEKPSASPAKLDQNQLDSSTDSVVIALSASSGQLVQAAANDKPSEADTAPKPQKLDIEI